MSKKHADASRDGGKPAAEAPARPDGPTELAVATVRTLDLETARTRSEHDLLGDGDVPADALWGIHTKRAVTNFPITGVPVGHFPEMGEKPGNISRQFCEPMVRCSVGSTRVANAQIGCHARAECATEGPPKPEVRVCYNNKMTARFSFF